MQESAIGPWLELCAEAAVCEDANRFQELIEEITAIMLEEKARLDTPVLRKLRVGGQPDL